jgi:hypothetical protein
MIKLVIDENFYLEEALDDIKKYYPNIDDDTFMQLIQLDPTYRGNNSAGKYGKWLLNLYNRGNLSEEEFSEVPDLLNQFTTYRNRIQNKDLNFYKSLDALSDTLANVVDDDSMLTDRQKVRFLKNVKSGKVKVSAEDDYDVVLETPKFIVYIPNTHEASMKLGQGTEWCTAHENPDWYNQYTKNGGKLYIVKNKDTGERWQYSDNTEDFLDEYDREFNTVNLLIQDKKLADFFSQFGFETIEEINEDGYYVYSGDTISDDIRSDISKILVADNVTEIKDDAFEDCSSLTSIIIPDNVISIGNYAFYRCISLPSISLPNSIESIGNDAFLKCHTLQSINIPNTVIDIGESAFFECKSLTSVNIPNGVTEIKKYTFCVCSSLVSIDIPDSVILIDEGAFQGCASLTSINVPNSVSNIEKRAFAECESLTSITLPNTITDIKERMFNNCILLFSIVIPNNVTSIDKFAFRKCFSLMSITIPDSVTFIDDTAFMGCGDDLVVYTNNQYVVDYCNRPDIDIVVKPLNKNESYKKSFKLHIKEN